MIVLFCFSLAKEATAQKLEIGQQFPELEISNTINYGTDELKFSDFKGKAIVLAFWGPWCTSCIKEFPEIDRLQKEFGDSMQIIMVNRDTKQRTEIFFKNRPQISVPFVPFITSDTVLSKFFEHTGVPYHVWIDSKGIIKHVSESYHLTEKNIRHFLLYNDLQIPDSKAYIERESLFDESLNSSVQYYSYISRCINENGLKLKGPKNEFSITSFDCSSIADLYQHAFGGKSMKEYFKRPGRTFFDTKDIDNRMRLVFYPAVIGWTLLGVWITTLKIRLILLKEKKMML